MDLKRYEKETTEQLLMRYSVDTDDEVTLSPTQMKIWERCVFVDKQFQDYYNSNQIATMITKRYGLGIRQACADVALSQKIFGGVRKPNADFVSASFLDKLLDALRRAKASNDLKVEADLLKSYQRYATAISSVDNSVPEIPKMVVIVTRPEDIGLKPVNIEALKRKYEQRNTDNIPDAIIVDPT